MKLPKKLKISQRIMNWLEKHRPMTFVDVFDIGLDATRQLMKDLPKEEQNKYLLDYAVKFRRGLSKKSWIMNLLIRWSVSGFEG